MENRSARACCREFCAPPRLRPSRRDVQNRPHAASATTATGSEPGRHPVASAAALREVEPPRFRAYCRNLFAPRAFGHLEETCRTDSTQRPRRPPRAPNPEGPVASAAALREIEPPRFRGCVAEISSSPRACGHLGKTCRTDPTLRPQRPPRAPNPAGTPLRPLRRCVRSNRRGFRGVLPKSLRPPELSAISARRAEPIPRCVRNDRHGLRTRQAPRCVRCGVA